MITYTLDGEIGLPPELTYTQSTSPTRGTPDSTTRTDTPDGYTATDSAAQPNTGKQPHSRAVYHALALPALFVRNYVLVGESIGITLPLASVGVGMITYTVDGEDGLPPGLTYTHSPSRPRSLM